VRNKVTEKGGAPCRKKTPEEKTDKKTIHDPMKKKLAHPRGTGEKEILELPNKRGKSKGGKKSIGKSQEKKGRKSRKSGESFRSKNNKQGGKPGRNIKEAGNGKGAKHALGESSPGRGDKKKAGSDVEKTEIPGR